MYVCDVSVRKKAKAGRGRGRQSTLLCRVRDFPSRAAANRRCTNNTHRFRIHKSNARAQKSAYIFICAQHCRVGVYIHTHIQTRAKVIVDVPTRTQTQTQPPPPSHTARDTTSRAATMLRRLATHHRHHPQTTRPPLLCVCVLCGLVCRAPHADVDSVWVY